MCAIHCMIWTAAVMAFAGWYQSPQGAWIAGLLYSAHFVQDRTDLIPWWMRFIGQRRFMQSDQLDMMTFAIIPGLGPWSIIVVDNVWHIVTIWAVWRFLA